MLERDTLLQTLPPDVHDDAVKLYDEAGQTLHDDPDPRDIVAELHRRGLLDTDQLRKAVLTLESSLQIRRVSPRPPDADDDGPEILGVLGAGAMGEVLIAKDPGLGRVYAVKRLHPKAAKRKAMLRRFYVEAQVTAQLDHPSIVPIHGLVRDDEGALGYAMKLVRGRTLEDYIVEARERADEEHVLQARLERFLHVCDAMAYAHARGVLHRDLKPENIMVGAFGEVIVMDWGIAKVMARPEPETGSDDDGEGEGDEAASAPAPVSARGLKGTKVGTIMGTPRYMSPEQAEGRTDLLDPRSDQYALGAILYELVTLQPAVRLDLGLDQALEWARTAKKQPFPRGTPRELRAIIDKAMSRKMDDRYADVDDLAEDVRRFLRDESVHARRDNLFQATQRWVGRHRQATLMLLFAMVLGFVVVTATLAVAGLAALEVQRYANRTRETQLMQLAGEITDRGFSINEKLRRVEGLVAAVSYSAEHALHGPPPQPGYDPLHTPPGVRRSDVYDGSITIEGPQLMARSGADVTPDVLGRLASLGPQMGQAMIESVRGFGVRVKDREATNHIAERGTPVRWVRVGTRSGVLARFPGAGAPERGARDFRDDAWFTAPKGHRGAAWTGPHLDPDGQGLVVSCSLPIFRNGKFDGTASVDLTMATLVSAMKVPLDGFDGYLVRETDGQVLAHTGMDDPRKLKTWEPTPFPSSMVWDAVKSASRHGFVDTGERIAMWTRIRPLGAVYVVMAPSDRLADVVAGRSSGGDDEEEE